MKRSPVITAQPIDKREDVGAELHRMLVEELTLAITACETHMIWDARRRSEAIRLARKALKRYRAVLDLVRNSLPEPVFESARVQARDLGRRLSPLRDRDVVRKTIEELHETTTGRKRKRAIRTMRAVLSVGQYGESIDHRMAETMVSEVAVGIRALLEETRELNLSQVSRRDVLDQVHRSWRRTRSRFRRSQPQADEQWQETRKRVIRLHHQLSALRPLDAKRIGAVVHDLENVASLLGADHDLSLVEAYLLEQRHRFGMLTEVLVVERELERLRSRYGRKATRRARKALERRPGDVRRRLRSRWK